MKSQSKLFLGLILVAFIIILGIYLGQQAPVAQQENNISEQKESIDDNLNQGGGYLAGSVVYLVAGTEGNDIYAITSDDESKRKIFTDKDEDLKIKQCSTITSDGKKMLAALAEKFQEFGSSLWFISTDGSGEKTQLIDNFASPSSPIISPNGKKIAYTIFSNVEPDYGFSLIIANNDGTNKQALATDSNSIANLLFSPDSQYVVFSKGAEAERSGLFKVKIDGTEEKEIYQQKDKEAIYSVSWSQDDKIAFSKGPIGNNKLNEAEIFTIDTNGKNLKQITDNKSHENFLSFSSDGNLLAYLLISYEDNPSTANKAGEIHLMTSDGKNDQSLGQEADLIIGWLP